MELWLCIKISWAYTCVTILCKSDSIVKVLEDVTIRLDLKLANRSQCYDGGSNMAGSTSGVKTQLPVKEPHVLYVHALLYLRSMDGYWKTFTWNQTGVKMRTVFKDAMADYSNFCFTCLALVGGGVKIAL